MNFSSSHLRRRPIRAMCVIAACLMIWSRAYSAEPIDSLPESTLLAVTWAGADAARGPLAQTALGKTLAEPDVHQFFEQTWREVEQKVILRGAQAQGGAAAALAQPLLVLLKSMWDRPCAVGLLGLQSAADGRLEVDAALVVQLGPQLARFKQEVERIAALARKGGAIVPAATDSAGADWTRLSLTPDSPPLGWTFRGDVFVLTVGAKAIAMVHPALSGGKTLTASAAYAAAMMPVLSSVVPASSAPIGASAAPPCTLMSSYYNAAGLRPAVAALSSHIVANKTAVVAASTSRYMLQAACMLLSVDGLASVGASMQLQNGSLRCVSHICTQGPRSGPLKLLEGRPIADADIAFVPRDATCLYASNTTWLDGLAGTSPTAPATLAILALEAQIGVKLRDDLLASMDDTVVLFNAPSNSGALMTGTTLCLKMKNAARATATLKSAVERMEKQSAGAIRLSTTRMAGREVLYIVNRTRDALPIAPAWGVEGRWLVIALYPQMVAQTLARVATPNTQNSIVSQEAFAAARKGLPAGACMLSFGDTRAAIADGYGLALAAATNLLSGMGDGLGIELGLIPSSGSLTRHILPAIGATHCNEHGALTVTTKSLPLLNPTLAETALVMPLYASVALAMPAASREKVDRAASLQRVKQLGVALQRWSAAHDNQFPSALDALVHGTEDGMDLLTSPADRPPNVSYVLLSGYPAAAQISRPDTRVLLYEKPELHGNAGTCVLYADGHVQWRPIAAFRNDLDSTHAYLQSLRNPAASVPASQPR